jgi:anti-sigma factor ChrR (cupin superfamily)
VKLDPNLRQCQSTNQADFIPYKRYGKLEEGMSWLPLSGEPLNGVYECFMLRMEPNTRTTSHEHLGHEEFLVLEGDLIDFDGVKYTVGDFVHLLPGSKHSSHTVNGCLLMIILRGSNRPL